MKKRLLLCSLLLLCILFSGMHAGIAAQNSLAVLNPGDEFALSLRFSGETAGLQTCIQWNPQAIALLETPAYDEAFKSGAALAMLNPQTDEGRLNLVYLRQESIIADAGRVLELRFRVNPDAQDGMQRISFSDCRLVGEDAEEIKTACMDFEFRVDSAHSPTWPVEMRMPDGSTAALCFAWEDGPVSEALPQATPAAPGIFIDTQKQPDAEISDQLYLRMRNTAGGFAVDLIAEDVEINGLQAEITYDAVSASLVSAGFTDEFAAEAIVQVVNDAQPGKISMVYSSTNGYQAKGEAIFTAQFSSISAASVVVSLENAKYTGGDSLSAATPVYPQQIICKIQPMDDLNVVEADGVRIVELAEGQAFSLTADPGESISLQIQNHLPHDLFWCGNDDEIASVTPQGLVEAHRSGLVDLYARDAQTGSMVLQGRICIRNAQFGIPMEIQGITRTDARGEAFVLASQRDEGAYALRGIALIFQDGEGTLRIEGLVPADMHSLPAGMFDLCGSLTGVEIAGTEIDTIEAGAFLGCAALKQIAICNPDVQLMADALPEGCELYLPEGSEAAENALHMGMDVSYLNEAGEGT